MSFLALLAGAYTLWAATLFAAQRSILFPGRPGPAPAPVQIPGQESWRLEGSGGWAEAWYQPAPAGDAPGPVVIFAHGNAELIDDWAGAFERLTRRGMGVLLVEYPGYGRSQGRPSEASIEEIMVRAYDALLSRSEVDGSRIVGFGRSLGGGAVSRLAERRDLAALVLQSTFVGVGPFARRYGLPDFLVRDRFDNLEVVRRFEAPVLVVHGTEDTFIPYEHGVRLAEAAPVGRLVSLPCAHNDCPRDWPALLDTIGEFLAEHGVAAGR